MAWARDLVRSIAYGGIILVNAIIGFYVRSTGKTKIFARGTQHRIISFVLDKAIRPLD